MLRNQVHTTEPATLKTIQILLISIHWMREIQCYTRFVFPILFLLFLASTIRHPPSVTLGFRSFQGKVFILSLPNLVWVFIGLIACMELLLVKIAV